MVDPLIRYTWCIGCAQWEAPGDGTTAHHAMWSEPPGGIRALVAPMSAGLPDCFGLKELAAHMGLWMGPAGRTANVCGRCGGPAGPVVDGEAISPDALVRVDGSFGHYCYRPLCGECLKRPAPRKEPC